jgi:hypothetical protein
MDIIVSSPKSYSYVVSRYLGHQVRFWPVRPRRPTDIRVGDKVYFAVANVISYYHIFRAFVMEPRCEETGRIWSGMNYILMVPKVDVVPVEVSPFYGFKYKEDA